MSCSLRVAIVGWSVQKGGYLYERKEVEKSEDPDIFVVVGSMIDTLFKDSPVTFTQKNSIPAA